MKATKQDIVDLVTITVENLPGNSHNVLLDGDNILIDNKPLPMWRIMACRNSVKGFINLIKETLR